MNLIKIKNRPRQAEGGAAAPPLKPPRVYV